MCRWLLQSRTDLTTTFHLEAAISLQHCLAASVEETDWATIVMLYGAMDERACPHAGELDSGADLFASGNVDRVVHRWYWVRDSRSRSVAHVAADETQVSLRHAPRWVQVPGDFHRFRLQRESRHSRTSCRRMRVPKAQFNFRWTSHYR